jgi:ubiquinone/menaquinone biosynthesis C-methylase UbiE
MAARRIPETDHGITGELNVQAYDAMMRKMRDRGWTETKLLIQAGIHSGLALEVGPGPGYLGLEWLKNTSNTNLKGLDISDDMITLSERNAREYDLTRRAEYVKGDACKMPFDDEYFDAVFTNGSLHEWAHPEEVLDEIARVLKPGGRYCISDLRRDMNLLVKGFLWLATQPKEMRRGLLTSIDSSYTPHECEELLSKTRLRGWKIEGNRLGIVVTGQKPPSM